MVICVIVITDMHKRLCRQKAALRCSPAQVSAPHRSFTGNHMLAVRGQMAACFLPKPSISSYFFSSTAHAPPQVHHHAPAQLSYLTLFWNLSTSLSHAEHKQKSFPSLEAMLSGLTWAQILPWLRYEVEFHMLTWFLELPHLAAEGHSRHTQHELSHSLLWQLLPSLHMLWPCPQAPCWASVSSAAAPTSHMHCKSWPNPISVSKTNFHRPWLWTSFLLSISAASWASPARTHHHPNPEQKEDSFVTFVAWGHTSI